MKKLLVLFLVLLLMPLAISARAEENGEDLLFEGQATAWAPRTLATAVITSNARGNFDPAQIKEGGYLTVDYTGTEGQIYLVLTEWSKGVRAMISAPANCEITEDVITATFTYEQMAEAYGSEDFSELDVISVGAADAKGKTTVLRMMWNGGAPADLLDAPEMMPVISKPGQSSAMNAHIAFGFTKHVGGEFDAAQINEGSCFYVEYSGTKEGVYLALSSHSGATQWARVNPDKTIELSNGHYVATFGYESFSKAWGTNFARLDQVSVYSTVRTEVIVHRAAYLPGSGDPVDTTDGRWDRPDTGIAFIGDSICQNPIFTYGDWNAILDRSDCVNFGIGGQTSVECLARIDELAQRDYHTVVFLCGINDIGWNRSARQVVKNYTAMLEAIREKNPDCQIIVLSVLPTTEAFYKGMQDKIVLMNRGYENFAQENEGVTFVDTYSHFTSKPCEYAYPELLEDGLHPNAKGYAVIAEVLKPYLPAEK